jgi:hypothetical protein
MKLGQDLVKVGGNGGLPLPAVNLEPRCIGELCAVDN